MRGASRDMARHRFTVVIEEDEDGVLVGSVPGLKGCHAGGATLDELVGNMREAIEAHLELLKARGVAFSPEKFKGMAELEIEVQE